jgi:tetratricopeptide (TPR) repeat protein
MNNRVWKIGYLGLVGSLVAALVAVPAAVGQDKDRFEEALDIFNRAKFLHRDGNFDEAVREYERAIRLDDENPWIYNALGLALTAKGDFRKALEALQKALELNSDLTDVHNNLGVVYSEMGDMEGAFREFSVVVRDPSYPTPEKALYNLGNLYLRQDNVELAHIHYRRAIEKNPDFALGYRGLGKTYLAMGETESAMAQFAAALEHGPDDIESLYELARLHEERGDLDEARTYYRRVVEVDRFSTLGELSLWRLEELIPET